MRGTLRRGVHPCGRAGGRTRIILRLMLSDLSRLERLLLAGVALSTGVTAVLEFTHADPLAIFVAATVALAGVAWVVSFGTEVVGDRLGPAATGFLQSTLGNLPELFIVLFALAAGELVVAQFAILGSIFANALLVLGLVIVAGALRAEDGIMRFSPRLPQDTATLLLLAVFIIVLLGAADQVGDEAAEHVIAISAVGAVVLLLVYFFFLFGYLRGGESEKPSGIAPRVPLWFGITLLALGGAAAAFVSDWFVAALAPSIERIGISRAFTGLVIVAIAGNAVENVVGIVLAAKGKSDLAISVVKNSVAQIAVFLFPLLVLLSLLFAENLTFVIGPVYIGALAITAIAIWQVTGDGEAAAFEGWALIGLFVILATLTFFE
jgi:Ca2+:H+ antiporter